MLRQGREHQVIEQYYWPSMVDCDSRTEPGLRDREACAGCSSPSSLRDCDEKEERSFGSTVNGQRRSVLPRSHISLSLCQGQS